MAILRAVASQLGGYFDGPTQVRPVALDGAGRAQAILSARMGGTTVSGVLMVDAGEGSATLVYDHPQSLSASLARMSQASGGQARTSRTPVPPLQTVTFPDRSGSLGIPEGWNVTSAGEGAVHARGPRGESVDFQNMVGCVNPGTPTATYGSGLPCIAQYTPDPVRAMVTLSHGGIRVLGTQPAGDGTSAIVYYEFQFEGRPYRGYGFVRTMLPTPDSWSWVFYSSYVAAPADAFPASFPTLMAIWKSWQADNKVTSDAMEAAAARMPDLMSYVRSAEENSSQTSSRVHRAMDLWARDSDLIDHDGSAPIEVNTLHAQELVDELNRQEGGSRWRVVPMAEYPH